MAFIGNLLWFIGGGFITGLLWTVAGLVCFITVVGIPMGYACFRIARFAFFPFGKDLIPAKMLGEKRVPETALMNLIWCLIFGWWLSLSHAVTGILWFCFFWLGIGIPFGIANFNLARACFAPLGQRIVSKDMGKAARARYVESQLNAKLGAQGSSQSVTVNIQQPGK